MNSTVSLKPVGCLRIADRRGTEPSGRSGAWCDPVIRPFRPKTMRRLDNTTRVTATVEIGVIPDVIALALAQLVRDRWAAELRGFDESRGRLHLLVTRQ